jgi:hypothetical protein
MIALRVQDPAARHEETFEFSLERSKISEVYIDICVKTTIKQVRMRSF